MPLLLLTSSELALASAVTASASVTADLSTQLTLFANVSGAATVAAQFPAEFKTSVTGTATVTGKLAADNLSVSIAAVDRTTNVDAFSIRITDQLFDEVNTATFECFGFTPALGDAVDLTFRIGNTITTLFSGQIVTITEAHPKRNARTVFRVECVDHTFDFDAKLVTDEQFSGTSGSSVVASLINVYTSGFTQTNVAAGLAAVDVEMKMIRPTTALARVAHQLGAKFYIDANKDVHFFVTPESGGPTTFDLTNSDWERLTYSTDKTQIKNKVSVEGRATTTKVDLVTSDTTIPVEDATIFSASGGTAYAGHSLITYTGRSVLTEGSKVAHSQAAPGAPAVAVGAAGRPVGQFTYKITFLDAEGGESAAGSVSGAVTASAFSAPGNAPSGAVSSSTLADIVGSFTYKISFLTAEGETTAGPASATVTSAALTPSSVHVGTASPTTGGNLTSSSQYKYKKTWVSKFGESTLSSGTTTFTLSASQNATIFNSGFDDAITLGLPGLLGIRLYRTKADGSAYFLVEELSKAELGGSYTDTLADSNLGQKPPLNNTYGGKAIALSSIATGPSGVLGRRIYRTKTGPGSEYFLVGQLNENAAATFTDVVPDDALGARDPLTNTAAGQKINLSSIPTGGSAIVGRRIYRTKASGSQYFLVGAIRDNTTTTFTDNVEDDNLGKEAPTESTIGALAGDTSIRVFDLSKFLASGWVQAGDQIITYTGRSAASGEGTLTGIPASGTGAIKAPIKGGASIVPVPHLTGVTGIGQAIEAGTEIMVVAVAEDAASQTTHGVREHFVQDRRLSLDSATKLATAYVTVFKDEVKRAALITEDTGAVSGKPLTISMAADWGINETLTIQRVEIFFVPGKARPQRRVEASNQVTIENVNYFFRQLAGKLVS